MLAALTQGVIAKKISKILIKIFIWGLNNSSGEFIKLTLNIIKGILKIITIILLIAKFLVLRRFNEPEIDANIVKIGELNKNTQRLENILLESMFRIIEPNGIIIINGNWKNNHIEIIFINTINSNDNPLILYKIILPSLKSFL